MPKYIIDEKGRECSSCGVYKPWVDEDGETNFPRHRHRPTGYDSRCKVCKNAEIKKLRSREGYSGNQAENRCLDCGAPVDLQGGRYCNYCRTKKRRLSQGNWYLVIKDPSECNPFLGRMIDALSLRYGLRDGHFPEGMQLRHIAWGKPLGMHVIRGKELGKQSLETVLQYVTE